MREHLNWQLVAWNIAEAREELQHLEETIRSGRRPSEATLRVGIEYAYHHLNFAWNARRVGAKRHRELTDADFRRFSRVPRDVLLGYE